MAQPARSVREDQRARDATSAELGAIEAMLDTLVSLVDGLDSRWAGLDEDARRAELRRIQRRVATLHPFAGAPPSLDDIASAVGLTRREQSVLELLVEGASTPEVGDQLGISTATVRSHVKSILPKLGVHSRIEAVALVRCGPAASVSTEGF